MVSDDDAVSARSLSLRRVACPRLTLRALFAEMTARTGRDHVGGQEKRSRNTDVLASAALRHSDKFNLQIIHL
jgi:hypothetical protein